MNLRRIRQLSIIAEEGSLHRAAARLGVDQPTLSRKLSQFEHEIGVVLFSRSTRGVTLTNAGECLLADMKRLAPQIDSAIDRARRVATGASTVVRLALTSFAASSPFVIAAIAEARRRWPQSELQLRVVSSDEQLEMLRSGQVDLAVLHRRGPLAAGFGEHLLRNDRYRLAVQRGHELTKRPSLQLVDLQPYDFAFASQADWPMVYHEWLLVCEKAGLRPRILYEAPTEAMFLNLIGQGLAIGFANSGMFDREWPDVAFADVEDFQVELKFVAVWEKHRQVPRLVNVVRMLAEHCPAHR